MTRFNIEIPYKDAITELDDIVAHDESERLFAVAVLLGLETIAKKKQI